jgi:hypothetical protein
MHFIKTGKVARILLLPIGQFVNEEASMKRNTLRSTVALAMAVLSAPFAVLAASEEDDWVEDGFKDQGAEGNSGEELGIDYFIDRLSPYGDWIETEEYGWVWRPNGVEDDWRPFTYGHWEYTDYGWTWVSYFPWGWAAFHYGSWAYVEGMGWLWVPSGIWSPARVIWRYSDQYVGWAPILAGYDYWVGWSVYPVILVHWTFISWVFFCDLYPYFHYVPHHHAHSCYHHTHYPHQCGHSAGPSCFHGPPRKKVEKLNGKTVERHKLERARSSIQLSGADKGSLEERKRPGGIPLVQSNKPEIELPASRIPKKPAFKSPADRQRPKRAQAGQRRPLPAKRSRLSLPAAPQTSKARPTRSYSSGGRSSSYSGRSSSYSSGKSGSYSSGQNGSSSGRSKSSSERAKPSKSSDKSFSGPSRSSGGGGHRSRPSRK